MKLRGIVQNGVIVVVGELRLDEGTEVEVEVKDDAPESEPTWAEVFKDITGKAEGLPPDYSINHDHYLHGLPKRGA